MKELVLSLYSQKFNPSQIGRKLGMYIDEVYDILNANGINKKRFKTKKSCKIDLSYFEKIDSHEKAQILGFIYADGCVRTAPNQPLLKITLHKQDEEYLETIKNKLNYANPLKRTREKYVIFSASNQKLSTDLINLGVIPNKSLILKFPTKEMISEEYLSSFILGYFEGDGSIYNIKNPSGTPATKIHFVGTKDFLERLKQILEEKAGVIGNIYKFNHSPAHYYVVGHQHYVKQFIEYVYSKNNFCMKKKI